MNNLQKYRLAAGMTQSQLAKVIGIEQGAVSHYENGRRNPDLDTCRKIVLAINESSEESVTLDDVFPPRAKTKSAA